MNISVVVSDNMRFDIPFEINYNLTIFLNVGHRGVAPLSVLLAEHHCTVREQYPWSSLPCVLLLHSAPMFGEKLPQNKLFQSRACEHTKLKMCDGAPTPAVFNKERKLGECS